MLLQPITVPFSKSTLKPSVYTLKVWGQGHSTHALIPSGKDCSRALVKTLIST